MSTPIQNSTLNAYTIDNKLYNISLSVIKDILIIEAKNENDNIKRIYIKEQNLNELYNTEPILKFFGDINKIYDNLICMIEKQNGIITEDTENHKIILKIPISFGQKNELIFILDEKKIYIHDIEKINFLEKKVEEISEKLEEALNESQILEEGDYIISSALDGNSCLEYINEGHKVILGKYEKGKKSQIFSLRRRDPVHHYILNDLDEILSAPESKNGSELFFSDKKNFGQGQLWLLTKIGKFHALSCYPNWSDETILKCMDVTDEFKIGSRVILWTRHTAINQLFEFKKIYN